MRGAIPSGGRCADRRYRDRRRGPGPRHRRRTDHRAGRRARDLVGDATRLGPDRHHLIDPEPKRRRSARCAGYGWGRRAPTPRSGEDASLDGEPYLDGGPALLMLRDGRSSRTSTRRRSPHDDVGDLACCRDRRLPHGAPVRRVGPRVDDRCSRWNDLEGVGRHPPSVRRDAAASSCSQSTSAASSSTRSCRSAW